MVLRPARGPSTSTCPTPWSFCMNVWDERAMASIPREPRHGITVLDERDAGKRLGRAASRGELDE